MNEEIQMLIRDRSCCAAASVNVSNLPEREKAFFENFMPDAVTAIALAHHVTTDDEWHWYATSDGGERCDADDHVRDLCITIRNRLTRYGYATELVKYPGESGLQFRYVAEAAGLGRIGINAFLFHPQWGPWVHLRVMGTAAEFELVPKLSGNELCDNCGLCISDCPAQAISAGSFKGLKCRSYRKDRGEYVPHAPDGLLPYCKRCIQICPKGKQPIARVDKERTVESGKRGLLTPPPQTS